MSWNQERCSCTCPSLAAPAHLEPLTCSPQWVGSWDGAGPGQWERHLWLIHGDSDRSARQIRAEMGREQGRGKCLRLHQQGKELGQVPPFQGGTGPAVWSCMYFPSFTSPVKKLEAPAISIHPLQNERIRLLFPPASSFSSPVNNVPLKRPPSP